MAAIYGHVNNSTEYNVMMIVTSITLCFNYD